MDEVERRLKAKGCLKCYLMVTVDNENAMRFYEAREWERMDTILTYTKTLAMKMPAFPEEYQA